MMLCLLFFVNRVYCDSLAWYYSLQHCLGGRRCILAISLFGCWIFCCLFFVKANLYKCFLCWFCVRMEKKQISLKTLLFSLLLFFVLVIVLFALYIFFSSSSFEFNDDSDSKLILPVGHLACESDDCRFDWARENQNVSLCFDIGDETLRASCSASITQSLIYEHAIVSGNVTKNQEGSLNGSLF